MTDDAREQAKAAIQKAREHAAQGQVKFAPRDRLAELGPDHTQRVLDAIGQIMGIDSNRVLITDESALFDFMADEEEATEIGKLLGVEVKRGDYIHETITRVRNKKVN